MILGYLGLGSNLGDRRANIVEAVRLLGTSGVRITKISRIYETLPSGVDEPQENYYNMACAFEFDRGPFELLEVCQDVERSLGRVRPYPRAPRTIDIDILCIGGVRIQDGRLTVPHPRMGDRPFVIHPLAEIAPELILPDGCTAQERRDRLGSTGIVRVTDV